jgi:hypothetical protein
VDGNLDAILAVEARLSELDSAREAATRELAKLHARRERAISDGTDEDEPARTASWTPQRKVALFAGPSFAGARMSSHIAGRNRRRARAGGRRAQSFPAR